MNDVYCYYPYHGIVKMTRHQYENAMEIKELIDNNEEIAIRIFAIGAKIRETKFFTDDLSEVSIKDIMSALKYESCKCLVIINERLNEDGKTYTPLDIRFIKTNSNVMNLIERYFHKAVNKTKENKTRMKFKFLYDFDEDYYNVDFDSYEFVAEDGEIKFENDFTKNDEAFSDESVDYMKKTINEYKEPKFKYYASKEEFDALAKRLNEYKESAEQSEFPKLLIADSVMEKANANPDNLYMRNKAMYEILHNIFNEDDEAKKYIELEENK